MSTLLMTIVGLVVGIALLGFAADRFIDASIAFAEIFRLSPLIIGMVLVGFGTSFPELVVSALAAAHGNAGLSIGNVIGSNIANVGMCLGVTALIFPLSVHSRILKREYVILCVVTLYVGLFVYLGSLTRLTGIALLLMLCAYLFWVFKSHKTDKSTQDELVQEFEQEIKKITMGPFAASAWWIFSLLLIFASSEILIRSAVTMAEWFHVSNLLIGLTVVAIGTSLPELAATIVSAKRGEADIAIGNVVGSNIFNLSVVLAMPALISPGPLASEILYRDYPMMLGFTLLFWLLTVLPPHKGQIGRFSGGVFVVAFLGYLSFLVLYK